MYTPSRRNRTGLCPKFVHGITILSVFNEPNSSFKYFFLFFWFCVFNNFLIDVEEAGRQIDVSVNRNVWHISTKLSYYKEKKEAKLKVEQ